MVTFEPLLWSMASDSSHLKKELIEGLPGLPVRQARNTGSDTAIMRSMKCDIYYVSEWGN